MNFQELESKYYELKGKHAAGKLSDKEFLTEVEKLSLQDEQGWWWTIEARTGQWYVFQEGEWVEAEPPRTAPPAEGVCPQCGTPVEEGAFFCGSCGHRLVAEPTPTPSPPPGPRRPITIAPPAEGVCPQCGAPVEEGAYFCESCGYSLVAEPTPPRPEPSAVTTPRVVKRARRGPLIGVMMVPLFLVLIVIALVVYERLLPTRPVSTRLGGTPTQQTLELRPTGIATATPATRATVSPTYAPMVTPAPAPTGTPTVTPVPTPTRTPTVTLAPTSTPTRTPTVTIVPTPTPTRTPVVVSPTPTQTPKLPTLTPVPPTLTPAPPTPTPQVPTSTPTPFAPRAVELLEPSDGSQLQGAITFRWTWAVNLDQGEVFDIRVCKGEGCQPQFGKTNTRDTTWAWQPDEGGGVYRWQVVVIRWEGDRVAAERGHSPVWGFDWSGGPPPGPQPTPTRPL